MLNKQGERSLAYLANVDDIQEITFLNQEGNLENCENIVKLVTGGWNLVVQRDRFNKDELFVFCEVDTILPKDIPLFSFLEGKRIRTKKLKGVVSQGVAFTIPEILDEVYNRMLTRYEGNTNSLDLALEYEELLATEFEEGLDFTELIGATKYDEYSHTQNGNNAVKTLPSEAKGKFPSFIWKTDEERAQNLTKEIHFDWVGTKVISREKLHGSSTTIYCKVQKSVVEGLPNILDYGICSRNLDIKLDTEGNTFVSTGLPVLKKLVELCNKYGESIALQGELLGPGINGNPYNLKEHQINFFTAQDLDNKVRYTDKELMELLAFIDENPCPISEVFELDGTLDQLLTKAEAKSVLNPKYDREGMVVRALDGSFSFKVISNKWLLKEKE